MRWVASCDECDPCGDDAGCCAELERSQLHPDAKSTTCVDGCDRITDVGAAYNFTDPPECVAARITAAGGVAQFEFYLDPESVTPDATTPGDPLEGFIYASRSDAGGSGDCDFCIQDTFPKNYFVIRGNDGSEILRCALCQFWCDAPCSSSSSSSASSGSGGGGGGSSASSGSVGDCEGFSMTLEALGPCTDFMVSARVFGTVPDTCMSPIVKFRNPAGTDIIVFGADFTPIGGGLLAFDKTEMTSCGGEFSSTVYGTGVLECGGVEICTIYGLESPFPA